MCSSTIRAPTASHVTSLRIDCLALTSKGFICSASNGTLYIFDKTEDPTVFQEARSVRLSEESSSPEATGSGELLSSLKALYMNKTA